MAAALGLEIAGVRATIKSLYAGSGTGDRAGLLARAERHLHCCILRDRPEPRVSHSE